MRIQSVEEFNSIQTKWYPEALISYRLFLILKLQSIIIQDVPKHMYTIGMATAEEP